MSPDELHPFKLKSFLGYGTILGGGGGRGAVTEAKYQKLRAHVEELRREHELVRMQAHHAAERVGAAGKVSEMQNQILAHEHEIAQLRDNNRALEMARPSPPSTPIPRLYQ